MSLEQIPSDRHSHLIALPIKFSLQLRQLKLNKEKVLKGGVESPRLSVVIAVSSVQLSPFESSTLFCR